MPKIKNWKSIGKGRWQCVSRPETQMMMIFPQGQEEPPYIYEIGIQSPDGWEDIGTEETFAKSKALAVRYMREHIEEDK